MTGLLNKKRNFLLNPIDSISKGFVSFLFRIAQIILPPNAYKRVEKYKSSNVVYNVIGLTFFNAIGGLLLILTNVKLANVMGASMFGIYSYYMAVGEVGGNIVRYGRHKTMLRDLVQYPHKRDYLISNTLFLSLINLSLFLIVIFLLSDSLDIEISLASLFLIIAPCMISLDFQPVYEAMKQMSWHSIYYLVQKLFLLLSIWAAIFFRVELTLLYVGIVLFFSWLLVLIFQYWEIIIQFKINIFKEFSTKTIRLLYNSNFLIALSCFIGIAFGPFIRLILKNYVDAKSVGIYSAGIQIFLISQFIVHQVSRVGNPMMAEVGKVNCPQSKRRKFVRTYLLVVILAGLPFVIPLIIFPQIICNICFTPEYDELSRLLPYFGAYLFFLYIGVVYEQFLISIRKDRIYFTIYVGGALLTFAAGFLVIPILGLYGGVLAFVIPGVLTRLLYMFFGEWLLFKSF